MARPAELLHNTPTPLLRVLMLVLVLVLLKHNLQTTKTQVAFCSSTGPFPQPNTGAAETVPSANARSLLTPSSAANSIFSRSTLYHFLNAILELLVFSYLYLRFCMWRVSLMYVFALSASLHISNGQ